MKPKALKKGDRVYELWSSSPFYGKKAFTVIRVRRNGDLVYSRKGDSGYCYAHKSDFSKTKPT